MACDQVEPSGCLLESSAFFCVSPVVISGMSAGGSDWNYCGETRAGNAAFSFGRECGEGEGGQGLTETGFHCSPEC
ncbi:Hypp1551 [Branchiostoma lanceolatum]|uniref:Hypp1551 protein n=1 Tax=Branchiostoma lanceolatum TaxID=7740 RepID=A0A8K0ELE7_BRALA|nr:Hypp1551 [Branchiostoma lanceolatum]